jgi:hypothetical protein
MEAQENQKVEQGEKKEIQLTEHMAQLAAQWQQSHPGEKFPIVFNDAGVPIWLNRQTRRRMARNRRLALKRQGPDTPLLEGETQETRLARMEVEYEDYALKRARQGVQLGKREYRAAKRAFLAEGIQATQAERIAAKLPAIPAPTETTGNPGETQEETA